MKKLILGLMVILAVGLALGYFFGWYLRPQEPVSEEVRVVIPEQYPEREIQLYFPDPQDGLLVEETAIIAGCAEDVGCIRSLVAALNAGSRQGNLPVLPEKARLLDVEIENDLVRLDFSKELVDLHPGGSLSELQTLYALSNSLSASFPYLRQVQILIDGKTRQTLKGHARIDQPVYADFQYNKAGAKDASGVTIEEVIDQAIDDPNVL